VRWAWVLIFLAGCDGCGDRETAGTGSAGTGSAGPGRRCVAEVTAGRGTHRASATLAPGGSDAALRKQLFGEACGKLCEADGKRDAARQACAARCQVDITAEKIGGRYHCR
jgi:hypothetical protein